jgi:cysteine desulfuration protein SufE
MAMLQNPGIDEIVDGFAFLDDWEDRYRYVIELGRGLEPLPAEAHSAANKVLGCASQVWLETRIEPGAADGPVLRFRGDSDAHLVRGLIAILLALYSGRTATAILDIDAAGLLDRLGLKEHLTPQRSNGVRAMVARIRREAERALAPA